MALIDYKNINIYQDDQLILKNINLNIGEGEFVYVTGKVGTGKSSLIKTLYGELAISEGDKAEVIGYNMIKLKRKHLPHLRKQLGIIFQDFQLLTDRTVEENLRFVLKATGWKSKADIEQRINDVLSMVGMNDCHKSMPNQLSGGEQQRIAIARAILNQPKLILADEPTGNLDPDTSAHITSLLQKISQSGSTVVMITHNMNLLDRFPGRVIRLANMQLNDLGMQNRMIEE